MAFAFGEGFMTGAKFSALQQEEQNNAKKAELEGQKLQMEGAQMAQAKRQNEQKLSMELFQSSVETMKGLNEQLKMIPSVKPGSALDQAIDQQKMIIAKMAEKVGQDPNMAEVIAQAVRAGVGTGIKRPDAKVVGNQLVQPNAEGTGANVLHTAPQAPQQPTPLMQEAAAAFPNDPAKQRALIEANRTPQQASTDTPLMKEAKSMFPDDPAKQQEYITNARNKAGVEVNLPSAAGETSAEKKLGDVEGDQAGDLLKERERATSSVERLQIVSALAEQYKQQGGSFGALSTKKIEAAKLMQAMGMKPSSFGLPDNVDAGEAIISMTNEMAMGRIGGQGGMPANQFSEADREFLIQTVPNIENTERGFKTKMQIAARVAQRKIEVANIFEEERAKGKTIAQAKSAAQKAVADKPIFTEEERKAIFGIAQKPEKVVDFSKMSDSEFLNTDLSKLPSEQRKAWLAEMKRRRP